MTNNMDIRWMSSKDVSVVNSISECSGIEVSIERLARKRDFICVVAEISKSVRGFALYRIGKEKISIKHLAVESDFRRMGIASSLVSRVLSKMDSRRSRVETVVSEYNLDAHLFLRSMGFRAEESVLKNGESFYLFAKTLLV